MHDIVDLLWISATMIGGVLALATPLFMLARWSIRQWLDDVVRLYLTNGDKSIANYAHEAADASRAAQNAALAAQEAAVSAKEAAVEARDILVQFRQKPPSGMRKASHSHQDGPKGPPGPITSGLRKNAPTWLLGAFTGSVQGWRPTAAQRRFNYGESAALHDLCAGRRDGTRRRPVGR